MQTLGESAQDRLEGPLTEESHRVYEAYLAALTIQRDIDDQLPEATLEDLQSKQDEIDKVVEATNISAPWLEETFSRAQDAVMPPIAEKVKVPTVIGVLLLGALLHVGGRPSRHVSFTFRKQTHALKAQGHTEAN
jgi:hypothetical protein